MSSIRALLEESNDTSKHTAKGIADRLHTSTHIGNNRQKLRDLLEVEWKGFEKLISFAYRGADVDNDGTVDLSEMEHAVCALLKVLPKQMFEPGNVTVVPKGRKSVRKSGSMDSAAGVAEDVLEGNTPSGAAEVGNLEPHKINWPAKRCVAAGKIVFVYYAHGTDDTASDHAAVDPSVSVTLERAEAEAKAVHDILEKGAVSAKYAEDGFIVAVEAEGDGPKAEGGGPKFLNYPTTNKDSRQGGYPNGDARFLAQFYLFPDPQKAAKAAENVNTEFAGFLNETHEGDPDFKWAILKNFAASSEYGEVMEAEVGKLVKVWQMYKRFFENHEITTTPELLKVMRDVDGPEGGQVGHIEAERMIEVVEEFAGSHQEKLIGLRLAVATWLTQGRAQPRHGMLRDKLVQRIKLENQFNLGCFRFIYFVALFMSFAFGLAWSNLNDDARGVQDNLVTRYELDTVKDITTLQEVKEFLGKFSRASSSLAPLSQEYWSNGGELTLLSAPEEFAEAVPMPDIDFWIGKSFTMQAWVQLQPRVNWREGLPIVRKMMENGNFDHSCFKWSFPAELSFGAHDYGSSRPNVQGLYEEYVSARYPRKMGELDEESIFVLHTLVVNETSASFYVGKELLQAVRLNRPVTDCHKSQSRLLLGSAGLTLAAVNFFPRSLTSLEIEETFMNGNLRSHVGYGLQKEHAEPLPSIEALRRTMNIDAINNRVIASVEQRVDSATSLGALAQTNPPLGPPTPTSRGIITDTSVNATVLDGTSATSIWRSPAYLDSSSMNLVPGNALPRLSPTNGFTISAWLKFTNPSGQGYLIARSIKALTQANGLQWAGYSDMCWFVYVGGGYTEFKFRSDQSDEGWAASVAVNDDPDSTGPTAFQGKSYRHFAFQVDPDAPKGEQLKLCIDGQCTGAAWTNSAFEGNPVDCEDSSYLRENYNTSSATQAISESKYWLNQRPPGAWPFTGNIANFQVFERALTEAEIQTVFMNDPDPDDANNRPMKQTKGCLYAHEIEDDVNFRDEFGKDCFWYYTTREQGLNNCARSPEAQRSCQVACQTSEQCWGTRAEAEATMEIWDQQMEFRATGSWGTSCVAKSTTAEDEAVKCGQMATNVTAVCAMYNITQCAPVDCESFKSDREELLACLKDVVWTTRDPSRALANEFMPCAEIVRTNVPSCAWDDTGLDAVANASNRSGEWSMLLWVEPVTSTKCLHPQVRLLDGDGLAFSQVTGYENIELDPPEGTGCLSDSLLSHWAYGKRSAGHPRLSSADITMVGDNKPAPGMKRLIVLGRKANGDVGLQVDSDSDSDTVNAARAGHIKPDKNFLRVINVMGDVRLSPIRLQSQFPTKGYIATVRYSELEHQNRRIGPAKPLEQQLTADLERDVRVFREKPFLIAPPLLIQSRFEEDACNWGFSDEVLHEFVRRGLETRCVAPYSCSAYGPQQVYKCPSDKHFTGNFFGLSPSEFGRDEAVPRHYLEFLATITDHSIVVRPDYADGPPKIMYTDEFLDTLTEEVKVSAIFYAVQFGVTTNLIISFDTTSGRVRGKFVLEHYVALTGDNLKLFWTLMMFVLLLLIIMAADQFLSARHALEKIHQNAKEASETLTSADEGEGAIVQAQNVSRRNSSQNIVATLKNMTKKDDLGEETSALILNLAFDAFVFFCALSFLGLILWQKTFSGINTEGFVGDLLELEWHGNDDALGGQKDQKKDRFVEILGQLTNKIGVNRDIELVGMVITMFIFIRMVLATSAHPRIAHITATLAYSVSDIMHYFVVFAIVICGFSMVATWRFGDRREDLATVYTAMRTLFDAVLGPPHTLTASDDETHEFVFFVVLVHIVNFFFLTAFFLAIVIKGYEMMMDDVETCTVEQDIISDLWAVFKLRLLKIRFRMPRSASIVHELERLKDYKYVEMDSLTKIFEDVLKAEEEEKKKRMPKHLQKIIENAEAAKDKVKDKTINKVTGHKEEHNKEKELKAHATKMADAFYKHYSEFSFLREEAASAEMAPTLEDVMHKVDVMNQKLVSNNHKLMDLMRLAEDEKQSRPGWHRAGSEMSQPSLHIEHH